MPGRVDECRTLDGLIDRVRAGASEALVVHGAAGVGKTALLEHVREQAAEFDVVGAVGVPCERELAFAGLHQLCAPMLDGLDRLPAPQHDALATAFALRAGAPPDPSLVGLAVLSLLADAAAQRPLLCLVDDAQWLDPSSLQTLAFVARRLGTESVALVFAARDVSAELAGLPVLVVDGLHDAAARALLDGALRAPLDERVRDRIVAEAGGNPGALLDLAGRAPVQELAGGFGLPDVLVPSDRIEQSVGRRLATLPADTRRLLLVAAAERVGAPGLVRRAADRLGVEPEAATPAVAAGLLELGERVRFAHPLARAVVYRAASPREQRAAHGALADSLADDHDERDRHAWHRAHATVGFDEPAAAELERTVDRAQAHGGLAAAAAFLERAAWLTPGGPRRAARALDAAQAKHEAGAPDAALELLAMAQAGPLDELQNARVQVLRARIAAASGGGDAARLLLAAARRLGPLDAAIARDAYLEALRAAMWSAGALREVAEAARTAPASPEPPRPSDRLLDGLVVLITDGPSAAAPVLEQALSALRAGDDGVRWPWLVCLAAAQLWDDEAWDVLSARHAELARGAGALPVLGLALLARAGILQFTGDLAAAAALIEEADAISAATGCQANAPDLVGWPRALLYNSIGRYDEALVAAQRAGEQASAPPFACWALVEEIEAAARSGKAARAGAALERLAQSTQASGSDWALGVEARSRALLSEGREAERLYREAIERLARTRVRSELARTHLLYGEWLRREQRRCDAREHLRRARGLFREIGAAAFAERAGRELVATGQTARKRTTETRDQLTAREAQIAELARDGLSNAEIGARMYISPRTVEYHLTKVFAKLNVTSRVQLESALTADPALLKPRAARALPSGPPPARLGLAAWPERRLARTLTAEVL